jgi:hypothetical protein
MVSLTRFSALLRDKSDTVTTLIALLRGINVAGNNKLPMKELSALLTGMGLRDVQTYIQSGNVVFRCDPKSKAALAAKISSAIERSMALRRTCCCSTRRNCTRQSRTILTRMQWQIPDFCTCSFSPRCRSIQI